MLPSNSPNPKKDLMKSRGFDLSNIGRNTITSFSVFKFIILFSLIILFLHVSLSLYTSVSSRDNSSIKQPILRISSSYSNSMPFSIYQSNSDALQDSSSPPTTFSSSSSKSSPQTLINKSSSSSSSQTLIATKKLLPKGCNLAKGEWVRDPNAPYYTNSTCGMIQEHQNCIKFGRPNLDFLKWRWKPDGCELPILDPSKFLELMRGKNLAFIGDSLARNQMQSLMCLLSSVEHPKELSSPTDNPTQFLYQTSNFSISFFWSPFLIRSEQSNHTIHNSPSWNLYLDEPDPLWPSHLPNLHHIVLNTGNWYTRPALFHLGRALVGCHHCPVPNAPFMRLRRAHRRAFRTALASVAARGFRGVAVVRTVSPSHFEGGECARMGPMAARGVEGLEREMYEEQLREFWRVRWEVGMDLRLMDVTMAMQMRPDGHPGKYGHAEDEMVVMDNDCVHWCLPGPVDMWNDFLVGIIGM